MPCCPQAYRTSPEQSNPLSAVPPQMYGVPSDSIAVCTTSTALPLNVAGGKGGGSAGGPPDPPPPPPPSGPPPPPPHRYPKSRPRPPARAAAGSPDAGGPRSLEPIAQFRSQG